MNSTPKGKVAQTFLSAGSGDFPVASFLSGALHHFTELNRGRRLAFSRERPSVFVCPKSPARSPGGSGQDRAHAGGTPVCGFGRGGERTGRNGMSSVEGVTPQSGSFSWHDLFGFPSACIQVCSLAFALFELPKLPPG